MAHPGTPAAAVVLTDDERATLEAWARRPKSAQALALRCRIVLACADGGTNIAIAQRLRAFDRDTVAKWRRGLLSIVWMVCMTNRGRVRRGRSPTTMSSG